ncbi:MAG TPA: DUF4129 domain-containing protein [Acidobacteriaceae bacterium]|jgi:hypothetical protein
MRLARLRSMAHGSIVWRLAAIAFCILAGLGSAHAAPITPQPRSLAEYRDHLNSLATLIEQCRQHIDASHCSADAVGPDDIVTANEEMGPRRIPYTWLRDLLELIGSRKIGAADARPMLQAAAERIQREQSEAPGSSVAGLSTPAPHALNSHDAEHTALTAILKRPEFRHADRSFMQRVLETVAIWINLRLSRLAEYSSHRRWLGVLLECVLAALACLGLAYWFVRQTRRARGLRAEHASQDQNAPAMRNWERLRQEAELAAAEQRWRDAVRGYYWATIARFDSRGQWPADRARTPREYLRLLLPGHPKHDDLRQLTRRFESCWYGSDTATRPDCDAARQLFERLAAR